MHVENGVKHWIHIFFLLPLLEHNPLFSSNTYLLTRIDICLIPCQISSLYEHLLREYSHLLRSVDGHIRLIPQKLHNEEESVNSQYTHTHTQFARQQDVHSMNIREQLEKRRRDHVSGHLSFSEKDKPLIHLLDSHRKFPYRGGVAVSQCLLLMLPWEGQTASPSIEWSHKENDNRSIGFSLLLPPLPSPVPPCSSCSVNQRTIKK